MKAVDLTTEEIINEYPPTVNSGKYPINAKQLITDILKELAADPFPQQEDPTMRMYWYKVFKPLYSRLGIITEDTDERRMRQLSGYISGVMSELVQADKIAYRDLNIIDRSRQANEAEEFTENPHIIAFIEKDAAYSAMKQLHETYGITVLSGKGQPSFAKTENILDKLEPICPEKDLAVITFTDYNPYGWNIARGFYRQVTDLWRNEVEHYHAGLYLEQFNGKDISNLLEPVKGNKTLIEGWLEWLEEADRKAVIVDGNPKGIELDALGSSEIYNCINKYMLQSVDLRAMLEKLERHYRDEVVERTADEIARGQSREIERQIRELESQREEIYGSAYDMVREVVNNGFNFSLEINENDILDFYRKRKQKMQTHFFYEEIQQDKNRILKLVDL